VGRVLRNCGAVVAPGPARPVLGQGGNCPCRASVVVTGLQAGARPEAR